MITCPTLFDFALHFKLGNLADQLSKEASEVSIYQFNTFLFADDAAFVFRFRTKNLGWIKSQLNKFFGYMGSQDQWLQIWSDGDVLQQKECIKA